MDIRASNINTNASDAVYALLASPGNWPKLAPHDKHGLNDRRDASHICNKT